MYGRSVIRFYRHRYNARRYVQHDRASSRLRLYRFLTTYTVQSGPDKGKPLLDGNAVSDRDFLRAVMRADYSTIYGSCVKGKMRCVAILLSKAYFKDWKGYRASAARSMGLTPESLAKYNVEKTFIAKLKELLPMIK